MKNRYEDDEDYEDYDEYVDYEDDEHRKLRQELIKLNDQVSWIVLIAFLAIVIFILP